MRLLGVLNGDYFRFLKAKKAAGDYEFPSSLLAWARAKRLSNKYGWKFMKERRG